MGEWHPRNHPRCAQENTGLWGTPETASLVPLLMGKLMPPTRNGLKSEKGPGRGPGLGALLGFQSLAPLSPAARVGHHEAGARKGS